MSVDPSLDSEPIEVELRCAPGTTCAWYGRTMSDAALARTAGDDRTARQLRGQARDHLSVERRRRPER